MTVKSFMNRKRLKVLGYRKLRMQKSLLIIEFSYGDISNYIISQSIFLFSDKSIPLLNNVVIVIGQRTVTKESSLKE